MRNLRRSKNRHLPLYHAFFSWQTSFRKKYGKRAHAGLIYFEAKGINVKECQSLTLGATMHRRCYGRSISDILRRKSNLEYNSIRNMNELIDLNFKKRE
jgi:hypothetical protein